MKLFTFQDVLQMAYAVQQEHFLGSGCPCSRCVMLREAVDMLNAFVLRLQQDESLSAMLENVSFDIVRLPKRGPA